MKLQVLLLGGLFCLGVTAQAQQANAQTQNQSQKTTQSANRVKRASTASERSITGCVDQQNGHYVLRDSKSDQLLNLEAPGDPDTYFARYVGHEVQANGQESSGTLKIGSIGQVADMCGSGR